LSYRLPRALHEECLEPPTAVVWAAAVLCGGLTLILLFFAAIGVINFVTALHLAVIMIAIAAFFLVVMLTYDRSERRGSTRWHDREWRGF
jgi:hypothetical protein